MGKATRRGFAGLPLFRAIGGDVFATATTLVVAQLLLAVAGVIASRALGPSARGEVTGVLVWIQIVPMLGLAGLNSALLVRISSSHQKNPGVALGNSLIFVLIVGSITTAGAGLLLPFLLDNLGRDARTLTLLALAIIPMTLLTELLLAIQMGLRRISHYNVCRLTTPVTMFVGTTALFLDHEITATKIIVLNLCSSLLSTIVTSRGLPWRHMQCSLSLLFEDAKFGLRVAVSGWMSFVNAKLDLMLMAVLVSATQVGFYGVANNAMLPVSSLAYAAASLLTPAVARIHRIEGENTHAQQIMLIKRDLRRFGRLSTGGGIALAAAAPIAIPMLFGDAFRPAIILIWVLIPGFVARALVALIVAGAIGMKRPHLGNRVEGVSLGATALLLPILLPRYEALGAAIASSLAYMLAAVAATVLLRGMGKAEETADRDPHP